MAASRDNSWGTFVLGVGAQKAGTTWLSAYLQSTPEFRRGFRKEYHLFDALDLESEDWMRRRHLRQAREAVEQMGEREEADAGVLFRAAMLADPSLYFAYFAGILATRPKVRATGDFTPDYALLSPERMESIRTTFDRMHVRTVAVFIMRDPVERVWSHIRMKAHRGAAMSAANALDELAEQYSFPAYERRTRYETTLAALDAAFRGDAHIGLYENLVTDATQATAICDLIGIKAPPPDFDDVRNASPRQADLPDDLAATVASYYADTYRAVAARCPELDIARWWPHSRHVL